MDSVQLALFDLPSTPVEVEEARLIAAGVIRHGHDLADHQAGWIVLPWHTAGGQKKGELVPAWACCVCGGVEPGEYLLSINHSCDSRVPSCVLLAGNTHLYRWRLASAEEIAAAGPIAGTGTGGR